MTVGSKSGERVYYYYFNGLYFISDIQLPGILEFEGSIPEADNVVAIKYGSVPTEIPNVTYTNSIIYIAPEDILLDIKDKARYLIKGKKEIIIELADGIPDHTTVTVYLLSIILGVVLIKHNIFSFHAATIRIDDYAVIIAGQSGVGKSTLSLGLYRKGYEIINDDISSVFFGENGIPYVYPGVHYLKLTATTLERYGYDLGSFNKIRPVVEKYSFPLIRTTTEFLPIKGLFLLREWNEDEMDIRNIQGVEKFHKIRNNIYRHKLVQHLNKSTSHFIASTHLANKIPVKKISRSRSVTPADFSDFMEAQFKNL